MAVFYRPTASAAAGAAGFRAFPNPSTKTQVLQQPSRAAVSVRRLDALGREVRCQPVMGAETSVSVATLGQRLYAAQWFDAGGRVLMSRKVARD